MNSTSQDAQTRRVEATSEVDQPFRHADSPEWIDVPDPTEDLANDVTSELAGNGAGPQVGPRPLTGSDSIVANGETTGVATVVATGTVLRDRYVLGLPLGYGGTSVVYQACDLRRAEIVGKSAEVAIKLLRPEFRDQPRHVARLRREFHQTQLVAHPNVVRFHDLDCDRGNWFIAMELLVGEPLGRRMRHASQAGLPAADALRIANACGDALTHAHALGVTHGDVKPDNVFITAAGDVRLLDFGVAPDSVEAALPKGDGQADAVQGAATRAYASPEILSGQTPESRDDVFSLACLIYEMLAGRHPYARRGADQARAEGLELERLPGISALQWSALASGLAWQRMERPQISELMRALCNETPAPAPANAPAPAAAPVTAPAAAPVASPAPAPAPEAGLLQSPALPATAPVLPVHVVEGALLRRPSRRWLGPACIGVAIIIGFLLGRFAFDSPGDSSSGVPVLPLGGGPDIGMPAAADVVPTGHADASAASALVAEPGAAAPEVAIAAQNSMPPGLVFFDSPGMVVSKRAVVAAIPMRHLSRVKRAVNVNWRLVAGTATPGRDYGGPESGVEPFVEGNSFRILYVPILANPGGTRDRQFTVELTAASPGAELGPTPRVVVTILGDS